MMRSALTMLGVFIGVAALIAMVAVGQGANEAVRKQIESLGTNLVVVLPGAATAGGLRGGFGSASTLTVGDAQAIRREATAVGEVSYLIRQSGQVQYGNQNWTTNIQGVSPNYPPITNWQIADGRGIHAEDEATRRWSPCSARPSHRQLFGAIENPIGALDPGQGRSVAGHRRARLQGTDALWHGPGRPRDDPVHHRRTQGARRCRANQQQTPINWIYPPAAQSLWPAAAHSTGYVNQIYRAGGQIRPTSSRRSTR